MKYVRRTIVAACILASACGDSTPQWENPGRRVLSKETYNTQLQASTGHEARALNEYLQERRRRRKDQHPIAAQNRVLQFATIRDNQDHDQWLIVGNAGEIHRVEVHNLSGEGALRIAWSIHGVPVASPTESAVRAGQTSIITLELPARHEHTTLELNVSASAPLAYTVRATKISHERR